MPRKAAILLLTFIAYALVLVHGIMPHQHLHQAESYAQQHSHQGSHSHHEAHDEPVEKESPFSHYFHSATQGEPHVSNRVHGTVKQLELDVKSEAFAETSLPCYVLKENPYGRALHKAGFSPPPYYSNFPQRGPPIS